MFCHSVGESDEQNRGRFHPGFAVEIVAILQRISAGFAIVFTTNKRGFGVCGFPDILAGLGVFGLDAGGHGLVWFGGQWQLLGELIAHLIHHVKFYFLIFLALITSILSPVHRHENNPGSPAHSLVLE